MKIVVLIGSPNKNGSTNMMAKEFEKGAVEAIGQRMWNPKYDSKFYISCQGI